MKVVRVFFLYTICLLFLISFVGAQGCADEGWKGNAKIYENKTVVITCTTCDFINFTGVNVDQEVFLSNVEMNKSGSTFHYTFIGDDLDSVGTYQMDGYSNLDTPLAFCFDVTMSGNSPSIGAYTLLFIFGIGLFLLLVWVNIKFNKEVREKLYNKIVSSYFKNGLYDARGNLGNVILYTLAYGLLKNLLMFYYLVVIFFLFILTGLVESFAISSLVLLFTVVLNVALWGFVLVFIYMIFSFYEIIKSLIIEIANMERGIVNAK